MDNIPTISDQMSIRETMTVIDKHAKNLLRSR